MSSKRWKLTGSPFASRVGQWTQRGFIRSIQRGTITLNAVATNTATITAVDPNNSDLRYLGNTYDAAATNEDKAFVRLTLTNATTITATRVNGASNICVVSYEVVEYWPGVIKSVQRGTVAVGTPATITAVTTTKAALTTQGWNNDIDGDLRCIPNIVLTNSTTVTASAVLGDGSIPVVGYQVLEWY